MRKIIFMTLALSVLFVQCRKKDINEVTEDEMVTITFNMPLNQTRSDFSNLLPFGQINWGNESKIERIYFANKFQHVYSSPEFEDVRYIGTLIEMTAEVSDSLDYLTFTCEVLSTMVTNGKTGFLYYFGNNGGGTEEGSNVTNIHHKKFPKYCIGKTISFAKQTGDINKLGDYHVASIPVVVKSFSGSTYDESSGYYLDPEPLQNKMSVAMLDLEGETSLEGNATSVLSFTLKWDEDERMFIEYYNEVENSSIDVTGNVGEKSFIALLPTCNEELSLECSKGKYVFDDCIERNQVYVGKLGQGVDDSMPLQWSSD